MVNRCIAIVILFIVSINPIWSVDAKLKIEKDVEQRAKIALIDISKEPNRKLFKILLSDLKISGHFLPDSQYRKGEGALSLLPAELKAYDYILFYSLAQQGNTKLMIRLVNPAQNKEIFYKSYAVNDRKKLPFLAHKAISDINTFLHYGDISWINRYVIYARYTQAKKSEIVLADYTFNYQKPLIRGGLNLFPIWADKDQKNFYYSSYSGLIPKLYKINIYTGAKKEIASSEGMLVCSDVSDDGQKLLLTMAPAGQADIYQLDLQSGQKRRITQFSGIDVGGKYVDGERNIVFVSNRLGYPNIFKKSIYGNTVTQLVHHGRNNNAVDGHNRKVVYSSRESSNVFGRNTFNLYLTDTSGSDTRPLTTTGVNLFPRFSVDGSVVLYLKRTGRGSSVGYINLESQQSQLFPISGKKIQSIAW